MQAQAMPQRVTILMHDALAINPYIDQRIINQDKVPSCSN